MNPYQDISKLKKKDLTEAEKALHQAFLLLAIKQSYGHISVTELCQKAHVARSTFYALYSNTDDLLVEIEDGLIVELLAINPPDVSDRDYIRNGMRFLESNHEQLHVLLVDQPDIRLINKWKKAVKFHFYDLINTKVDKHHGDLVLELISSMAVSAYTWYLDHPAEVDLDHVIDMITMALKELK